MYVHMHAQDIEPFQKLFVRVSQNRLPWRISFLIESGGLKMVGFKNMIASIISFTNPDNKVFREAVSAVREMVKHQNELDVRLRVDFATWAPKDDEKLLASRASRLARAVQGWGGVDIRETSGDQFQGFTSSALCLSLNSVATPSCAVLGMSLKCYRCIVQPRPGPMAVQFFIARRMERSGRISPTHRSNPAGSP